MVKPKRTDALKNRPEALQNENQTLRASLTACEHVVQEVRKSEEALKLALEQIRLIVDHADDEIFALDPNGTIIYINKKLEELFGYRRDEVMGKKFVDVAAFEHYKQHERDNLVDEFFAMMKLEQPPVAEVEIVRKDGKPVFVEASSKVLRRDGQAQGVVFTVRDISERKKTEARLRDLYEEEREVRQRIETDMKRRVEFTRAVAHELKTPLTPIMASIDTLTNELKDERLLRLARSISQGASSLDKRIDELLDLARGEVGMLHLRLEPVDLRPMLQVAADGMTPLALSNGLSLLVHLAPSLPMVRADVTRMEQVITNLLHNAIKFTPKGGKITLAAKDQGANIVIEVRDTGPGISKRQKEHIFEPYRGLGTTERRLTGLGLGLALCKMIIELHSGQIWVRSRPGKGSVFGFSLPVETAKGPVSPQEASNRLWKILVIEDDPEIVNSLGLALEKEWSQAALLATRMGGEGVELVETEQPDIVVLDLSLPDMHGLEVLQEIRLFSSVPVVVLTVSQEERDITRSLGLGANDYVTKPFRMKELLARLKVHLRSNAPSAETADLIVCGSLSLDPSTFEVRYGPRAISLTAVEGRILQELMVNAGKVVTHDRLADAVWGEDHPETTFTLRTHISRIRQKLQPNSSDPKLIVTKAGIGYSLVKIA